DSDSDVYRAGMHDGELRLPPRESWMEPWEKKTNEKKPWDQLWSFIDGLNRSAPSQFSENVSRSLDVDAYLTWMVVDSYIANDVQGDARSYWVFDKAEKRWSIVPWDLNNAISLYNRTNGLNQSVKARRPLFGFTAYDPLVYELMAERRQWYPDMTPTYSTLSTRILDDETLRARHVEMFERLLATRLREEDIGARIDAMHALLRPYYAEDPWVDQAYAANAGSFLRRYVRERTAWLRAQLPMMRALGQTALVLDRVGRDAAGNWYVSVRNQSNAEVPLAGMYLSGFSRAPAQWRLAAGSVPAGGTLTLRQDTATSTEQLGATINPERVEAALYASDGITAVDLIWLPPVQPGESYGRATNGGWTKLP
ncbi:MAG TPA: CotH kinase family protein, partial [Myxococcaceae bacterium]|nr:CotH kinase family protein [Myxococcaceae bacterium]